ncbi:MAG: GNAT family N-acetyltransferase [Bacillota bacterium]
MDFDKLETERIILRTITKTDLDDFLHYRSSAEVARYQFWEPFSRQQAIEYLDKYAHSKPGVPGEWFQLGIVDKITSRLIGDCSIKLDSCDQRIAEVGFSLSHDYQNQGFASEALRGLFDYAFNELNVHRIFAITDCENRACVKLLERLKMRREGHFLKNIWFKGNWGSEYCYAILECEWDSGKFNQL